MLNGLKFCSTCFTLLFFSPFCYFFHSIFCGGEERGFWGAVSFVCFGYLRETHCPHGYNITNFLSTIMNACLTRCLICMHTRQGRKSMPWRVISISTSWHWMAVRFVPYLFTHTLIEPFLVCFLTSLWVAYVSFKCALLNLVGKEAKMEHFFQKKEGKHWFFVMWIHRWSKFFIFYLFFTVLRISLPLY